MSVAIFGDFPWPYVECSSLHRYMGKRTKWEEMGLLRKGDFKWIPVLPFSVLDNELSNELVTNNIFCGCLQ